MHESREASNSALAVILVRWTTLQARTLENKKSVANFVSYTMGAMQNDHKTVVCVCVCGNVQRGAIENNFEPVCGRARAFKMRPARTCGRG